MGEFSVGLYEELSLYVRHSAWLNAVPERPKNDQSEAPRRSRLEQSRKDDDQPDMPPIEEAGYLLGYLFEVGPTMAAGGYPGPVTHEELRAWMDLTGIELQPWEVRFLRRLSHEYLAESRKAEKRDCPAPWRAGDVKPVVTDAQAALRALARL